VAEHRGEGWAEPRVLDSPVSAFNANGGFSIDGEGNLLVSIERDGGLGAHDLYLVRRVGGDFPIIQPLPGAVNTAGSEIAPFIDPERRFLLFTSFFDGALELRVSLPDGNGGWGEGSPVPGLDGQSPKFAGLSPDGSRLFFVSERPDADANPQAEWSFDRFSEPVYEDNADIFWMSSRVVTDVIGEGADSWKPTIEVSPLGSGLYRLTTDQGAYTTNSLAFVGDDGVLLVDTQSGNEAEALKSLVDGFERGLPKLIIYTHRHVEHVGGAAIFGESPLVIAHDLVRSKLRSGAHLFDEFPDATMPDLSFADRMTLRFNGEEIDLVEMAGSHDDNEIAVHFKGRKVVHLSSLTNGFNLPSVDGDGDALAFAPLIARAMEEVPEDAVIVSGHNANGSWRDLEPYREMLVGTEAAVRSGLEGGLDAARLKEAKVLQPWEAYAGSYVSTDQWIDYLVVAIETEGEAKAGKDIYAELYFTLRDHGVDEALARYAELRASQPSAYDFNEFNLLTAGSKLLGKGRPDAAAAFLELETEEYPDGDSLYYTYYLLAQAHLELDQREAAVEACRRALELKPDNRTIRNLLTEIEGRDS
jgi:glyoxylase-like metal-dependent hydrolase (beta-lactamase superfamily II)